MDRDELRSLRDSWLLAKRGERKSPNTIRSYRDGTNAFLQWSARTGIEPELEPKTVWQFAADLATEMEGSTVRHRVWTVCQLSAWAAEEEEIPEDRLRRMKMPGVDEKPVLPLTDEELRLLLSTCRDKSFRSRRDEAIIRLLTETTARAEELIEMRVSDTQVQAGTTIIRRGKGGKGRVVAFSPTAALALDRYLRLRRRHRLAATDTLWLGDRGASFAYSGLYRMLVNRGEAAGIQRRVHPHLFRHTSATRWLGKGGSQDGLMAMAGWNDPRMLHRYVKATQSQRAAEEARRLNLGDL